MIPIRILAEGTAALLHKIADDVLVAFKDGTPREQALAELGDLMHDVSVQSHQLSAALDNEIARLNDDDRGLSAGEADEKADAQLERMGI